MDTIGRDNIVVVMLFIAVPDMERDPISKKSEKAIGNGKKVRKMYLRLNCIFSF